MVDKYQGPVPEKASVEKFRKTGMTIEKKSILKRFKIPQGKIRSKEIVKPSKYAVKIKEYNTPDVLGDENRFFKDEMKQAEKEMFFT